MESLEAAEDGVADLAVSRTMNGLEATVSSCLRGSTAVPKNIRFINSSI